MKNKDRDEDVKPSKAGFAKLCDDAGEITQKPSNPVSTAEEDEGFPTEILDEDTGG